MEPAVAAARLAQFAGAVVLFGAPLFRLYGLEGPPARWRARLLGPAALLLLVGAVVVLVLQALNLTGSAAPAVLIDVGTGTQFGSSVLARMAFGALAAAAVPFADRRGGGLAMVLLGAGALASFAWTGHGTEGEGTAGPLHLAADLVHLAAAGVWLGALASLALLLVDARRDPRAASFAAAGLSRFSGVGTWVVAALLASGAVNTWVLMGAHALQPFESPYGRVLAGKLALFMGMLALAAVNRWRLAPRLAGLERSPSALAAARTSVLVETGLGLLVLGAVAFLGTLSPPE